MYNKPKMAVDKFCDVYTSLAFDSKESTALLTNKLEGTCEIFVPKDFRIYELTLKKTECGSKIYQGSNGSRSITLTDHRARLCRDIVPAKIIVEETNVSGMKSKLFSQDKVVTERRVTVTGKDPRDLVQGLKLAGVENGNFEGAAYAEYGAVSLSG